MASSSGRMLLPVPVTLVALTAYLLLVAAMDRFVPEAYMDEPFHIPQTQQYCQGHFARWDPKISTFPGLYIAGTAYTWLAWLLVGWWSGTGLDVLCSGPYLRSLNGLLSVACMALFYALAMELRTTCQRTNTDSRQGQPQPQQPQQQEQEHQQQQQQQQGQQQLNTAASHASSNGAGTGSNSCSSGHTEASPLLLALVLALYPLHAFYSALYYTDVGALAALLACHLALLQGRPALAAAAGAAAVAFRQTNAVWVAFLLGAQLLRHVESADHGGYGYSHSTTAADGSCNEAAGEGVGAGLQQGNGVTGKLNAELKQRRVLGQQPGQQQEQQQQQQQQRQRRQQWSQQLPLHKEVAFVLQQLWLRRQELSLQYWLVLLVPLAFAAFVLLNGGVAVGDRSAHAPVLHAAQLLYMALFVTGTGMLLLRPMQQAAAAARAFQRSPVSRTALAVAAAGVCAVMVARGTFVHPYLVADNRHYTFYIWRRLFGVHPAMRYVLVPLYVASWGMVWSALGRSVSRLWRLGFIAACVATLVPAGLVEFRYYTVPFMLTVLHAPPPSRAGALCTAAAFLLVDAITLYVFMLRPFKWPDGSTARFMW